MDFLSGQLDHSGNSSFERNARYGIHMVKGRTKRHVSQLWACALASSYTETPLSHCNILISPTQQG